jgi:hypothetical protein
MLPINPLLIEKDVYTDCSRLAALIERDAEHLAKVLLLFCKIRNKVYTKIEANRVVYTVKKAF